MKPETRRKYEQVAAWEEGKPIPCRPLECRACIDDLKQICKGNFKDVAAYARARLAEQDAKEKLNEPASAESIIE